VAGASQFQWAVATLLEHYQQFASLNAHRVGDKAPSTDDHLHATAETQKQRQAGMRRNIDGELVAAPALASSTTTAGDSGDDSESDSSANSENDSESDDDDDYEDAALNPTGSPRQRSARPWCHCCLLAFSNVYSLAWAAFQSGGVGSLLAFLHSHFKWGSGRATSLCAAMGMRLRLDCGGMAAFFIHICREVSRQSALLEAAQPERLASSLHPFPFTVVGVCLVLTCSAEERRRWLQAARRAGRDTAWIGPSSSPLDQAVCYHQCMVRGSTHTGELGTRRTYPC